MSERAWLLLAFCELVRFFVDKREKKREELTDTLLAAHARQMEESQYWFAICQWQRELLTREVVGADGPEEEPESESS